MEWITYALVLIAICAISFIIRRLWVGLVDAVIGGVKKIFNSDKGESTENWKSLDDIRREKKKNN